MNDHDGRLSGGIRPEAGRRDRGRHRRRSPAAGSAVAPRRRWAASARGARTAIARVWRREEHARALRPARRRPIDISIRPSKRTTPTAGRPSNASMHFEHDLTPSDRFGVIFRHGQARFLVPNEHVQQDAGQRQDRDSRRKRGAVLVSADPVAQHGRRRARRWCATCRPALWSNAASTPIVASQDRGFRELYVKGSRSRRTPASHEWKVGGDFIVGDIRERFAYRITDPDRVRRRHRAGIQLRRTPSAIASRRCSSRIRSGCGPWTVNAGLRWDRYALVVDDHAFSPRLAVAWSWPAADLVVRARRTIARSRRRRSRTCCWRAPTPSDALGDDVVRLPVPAIAGQLLRGGPLEGVGRQAAGGREPFSARQMTDVADDDVLLNTGVSFPIAFRHGRTSTAPR